MGERMRWRSVADELPTDESKVLIWTASNHGGAGCMYTAFCLRLEDKTVWRYADEYFELPVKTTEGDKLRVTHWMPMPNPPEAQ